MKAAEEWMQIYREHIQETDRLISMGDNTNAHRQLKLAVIALYEAAKVSEGHLRMRYLSRAENLHETLERLTDIIAVAPSDSYDKSRDGKPFDDEARKVDRSDEVDVHFDIRDVPSVSFADVAGMEELKEELRSKILYRIMDPDAYKGYNINPGGGIFLYGPPGSGKTMMAAAIAHEVDAPFITIRGSDLFDKWQGVTEKRIKALFAQARSYRRCVIFFDEMDALMPKESTSTGAKQARAELLSQLQGIEYYYENNEDEDNLFLVIGATNKPWEIDEAFLREGRFGDTRIFVPLPNFSARKEILSNSLSLIQGDEVVIEDDIDLNEIAHRTKDFNGAGLKNLFEKVQLLSISRFKEKGEKYICQKDFMQALEKMSPVANDAWLEKYRTWSKAES